MKGNSLALTQALESYVNADFINLYIEIPLFKRNVYNFAFVKVCGSFLTKMLFTVVFYKIV